MLAQYTTASEGSIFQLELPGGGLAEGVVTHIERDNSGVSYLAGRVSRPSSGRFFFQRQSVSGQAGDFVGILELPGRGMAYRLEPTGFGGSSELVERPLREVLCLELPQPVQEPGARKEAIPPLNPDEFPELPTPDYQNGIVVLESLRGATPVIYLDFQGGYTPTWGGITYERSTYNSAEIRELWKRVAEDFMPFNINVTTDLKVFQAAPQASRQRIIITPTDTPAPGAGGVAYVGSFDWTEDTPCWAFVTNGPVFCAQACSHEVGHTMGLLHSGQNVNGVHLEYYYGHGSGETGWAPIMGVAYYENVTQWSHGEYINADNSQPQLSIIAARNNVHLRVDDTGGTLATARYLEVYADFSAGAEGVIESAGDTDAFRFTTGGGMVDLRVNPVKTGPDLALQATLCDGSDTVIATDAPGTALGASITTNLPAGTYTFRVNGTGRNDPRYTGFSDYASRGYYAITGSVANAQVPDRFVVAETATNGTIVGRILSQSPPSHALSFVITAGNSAGAFAVDGTGALTVVKSNALNYRGLATNTQFSVRFELFVDIVDLVDPTFNQTARRVLVAVTPVNKPPVITGLAATGLFFGFGTGGFPLPVGNSFTSFVTCLSRDCVFEVLVLDHSPSGTVVGRILAEDPDPYTVVNYSIASGNETGAFAIDPYSGTLTVAGDLSVAAQNLYALEVVVSDQTPPVPLVVTSTVNVNVLLPYQTGGIACAAYNGLPGTLVADLTNAPSFPLDPDWIVDAFGFGLNTPYWFGSFEFPGFNSSENFGVALRGYLLPPVTGDYTFWISSEADSELWLSASTNAADASRIAYVNVETNWPAFREWDKYPSQRSLPVRLGRGQVYYMEARLKVGNGTNHLSVGWESSSNGVARSVIDGQFLSPYRMNFAPQPIGFTMNLHTNAFPGAFLGRVGVQDLNRSDSHTFELVSGNENHLFDLDPATGVIRLSTDLSQGMLGPTHYDLLVRVSDNGTPPLSATTEVGVDLVPAGAFGPTNLMVEIWTNLPGSMDLGQLANYPAFPRRPDLLFGMANFDTGMFAIPGRWAARVRAILTPKETGSYVFFVAGLGSSRLKLGSLSDPDHAPVIAASEHAVTNGLPVFFHWEDIASPPSGQIVLETGRGYYLEALLVCGGSSPLGSFRSGSLISAWTGAGLAGTNVIDASFLAPLDLNFPPELPSRTVQIPITAPNGYVVLTLAGVDSALDPLAYRIVSGNVSNAFALDAVSGRLTVANNAAFATHDLSDFTLTVEAQDSGYGGRYPLRTGSGTVGVRVIDNTPSQFWFGRGDNDYWSSSSNWVDGLPGDASKLTFAGSSRQTNHNDLLARVAQVTLNNSGFFIEGNPLTIMNGITSTGDNTWAIDSSLAGPQTFFARLGVFTVAGAIHNGGNTLFCSVDSTMRLDGIVSGSGGLTKASGGTLILAATNEYTGPTTVSAGTLAVGNLSSLSASPVIELLPGARLDLRGVSPSFLVPAGHVLKGSGTVLGSTRVEGSLVPTPANVPMVFNGTLVLAGTTSLRLALSASPPIAISGTVVYGGELEATNGLSFYSSVGATFRLFGSNSPSSPFKASGAFSRLSLPPLSPGLRWDTRRLTTDGTIAIAYDRPTILPVVVTNGTMIIQFETAKGMHYVLEAASSLEPPSAWIPLYSRLGTGSVTAFNLPANPGTPRRFFRVRMY
jgi:autotransporter-associated beta strand protein